MKWILLAITFFQVSAALCEIRPIKIFVTPKEKPFFQCALEKAPYIFERGRPGFRSEEQQWISKPEYLDQIVDELTKDCGQQPEAQGLTDVEKHSLIDKGILVTGHALDGIDQKSLDVLDSWAYSWIPYVFSPQAGSGDSANAMTSKAK